MALQQIEMVQGKKYRGSASINNYGEIHFTPDQVGTKPDNMTSTCSDGNVTLYESKNMWKISVKIDKGSSFRDLSLQAVSDFQKGVNMLEKYVD